MNEILSMDMTQVDANLQAIMKSSIPGFADEGLFLMAEDLLFDATAVEPTTPKGHYRKSDKRGGVGGTLRQSGKIERGKPGEILAGFNMPYAAYQHEGQRSDGSHVVQRWSEAGSGKEFLRKKLEMFRDAYLKKFADYIKGKGGA